VWPSLEPLSTPALLLRRQELVEGLGIALGRTTSASRLLELATALEEGEHTLSDDGLAELVALGLLARSVADLAILAAPEGDPDDCEEPIVVTKSILRPVSRILDSNVDTRKRQSDGRIAVSSLVGYGPNARAAHLALIEIAARICRPAPDCTLCPVEQFCLGSERDELLGAMLPVSGVQGSTGSGQRKE
jgi:DNA (cytosine-5)-methyltransferase 1